MSVSSERKISRGGGGGGRLAGQGAPSSRHVNCSCPLRTRSDAGGGDPCRHHAPGPCAPHAAGKSAPIQVWPAADSPRPACMPLCLCLRCLRALQPDRGGGGGQMHCPAPARPVHAATACPRVSVHARSAGLHPRHKHCLAARPTWPPLQAAMNWVHANPVLAAGGGVVLATVLWAVLVRLAVEGGRGWAGGEGGRPGACKPSCVAWSHHSCCIHPCLAFDLACPNTKTLTAALRSWLDRRHACCVPGSLLCHALPSNASTTHSATLLSTHNKALYGSSPLPAAVLGEFGPALAMAATLAVVGTAVAWLARYGGWAPSG